MRGARFVPTLLCRKFGTSIRMSQVNFRFLTCYLHDLLRSFHVVSKLNNIVSILYLNVPRLTRSIIDIRGKPKLEILNPGLELRIL